MLTDAYWRSRFGASTDVIGATLKLDGEVYTIAGVLPKAFHLDFTSDPDLYLPLDLSPAAGLRPRRELGVIGRLAPGVTIAAARAEMEAMGREPAGRDGGDWTTNVEDLRASFNKFRRGPLLLFFGFAVLGLVVACANVAALQLARYAGRRRESALRIALGANRLRLAREAMAESAWIAVPGAGAGVLLSMWGLDGVRKFMPLGDFVRSEQIQMDAWTLAFVLAVCGATVLLFALAPVFSAGKIDPIVALRTSKRGMGGETEKRASVFVMAEVAISFVLLFAAGLFMRTHKSLLETPMGFDARHVAAMRVSPGGAQRPASGEMRTFARRVLEAAGAVPGVGKAAISGGLPLQFDSRAMVGTATRQAQDSLARIVSPTYFDVLSIPLLAGRAFTNRDSETAPRVAIVNRRLARKLFGAENAVGKTLQIAEGGSAAIATGEADIVGVAADTKELGLNEIDFDDVYLPFEQNPLRSIYVAAKIGGDSVAADAAIGDIQRQLRGIEREVTISDAATMEQRLDEGLRGNRSRVFLVTLFAALAALLAAVGIHGSIAIAVAQRTAEFGLRMALGARPMSILSLAAGRAGAIAAAGVVFGGVAAFVLGELLRDTLYLAPGKHSGILFGVGVHDSGSLAAAAIVTLGLAAVAAFAPAARAAAIDPGITLRQD
jgi:putative ABC transport system permease protein